MLSFDALTTLSIKSTPTKNQILQGCQKGFLKITWYDPRLVS
jgi:hypothetical protein